MVLFSLLLCLALVLPAAAEGAAPQPVNTALLLGTREAELEGFGTIRVVFGADGMGTTYAGDQAMVNACMSQGDVYAPIALENGEYDVGRAAMEYPDADTVRLTSDDGAIEYRRVEPSEATELSLDNPFIGKWEADIPSAGAVITFEFRTDGSYEAAMGDQSFGDVAYMMLDDRMVTFEGDELCEYVFAVVDADNIDVTEDGQTARFSRAGR